MTEYVAYINTPGYLPMDDDPPVFNTTAEAWAWLADERVRDEDEYEGETYSATADELHARAKRSDGPGTVYGPTPGYDNIQDLGLAYTVAELGK